MASASNCGRADCARRGPPTIQDAASTSILPESEARAEPSTGKQGAANLWRPSYHFGDPFRTGNRQARSVRSRRDDRPPDALGRCEAERRAAPGEVAARSVWRWTALSLSGCARGAVGRGGCAPAAGPLGSRAGGRPTERGLGLAVPAWSCGGGGGPSGCASSSWRQDPGGLRRAGAPEGAARPRSGSTRGRRRADLRATGIDSIRGPRSLPDVRVAVQLEPGPRGRARGTPGSRIRVSARADRGVRGGAAAVPGRGPS